MGLTGGSQDQLPNRLLLVGNIPVDLTVRLDRLPASGEDVRGLDALALPGGGFNVLHAAWVSGLPGRFAGSHGSGPFGDLVRRALADIGCELLQPPRRDRDSGWVIALVDSSGERTFVSSPDAVVAYQEAALAALPVRRDDLVYVSGYSLGLGDPSRPLAAWVSGVGAGSRVFCDLGPWGATAPREILVPVLERVDWLSCNAREAALVTGEADPAAASAALQRRTGRAVVLVRDGAAGCWVATPPGDRELVPAPEVRDVVDSTGAGDTHSGVFLAAVVAGEPLGVAVAVANEAAARAVTRPGGASWGRARVDPGSGEEG